MDKFKINYKLYCECNFQLILMFNLKIKKNGKSREKIERK